MPFFTINEIDRIINCSKDTREIIMKYFHSDFSIDIKKDDSPVTEADLAASHHLESNLPLILNVPVLSEESPLDSTPYLNWETYWLIDPIDGTRDFINKTKDFCICIALIHKNKAVFGLINACYDNHIWFAELGQGAFKMVNDNITPMETNFAENPVVTISAYNMSERLERLLSVLPNYSYYRRGSALKYIDIAEGKANIYPKLWDTCEWDTAAAQIILEESGGKVIKFDGTDLKYGTKPSLINPHFVAYSGISKNIVDKILANKPD